MFSNLNFKFIYFNIKFKFENKMHCVIPDCISNLHANRQKY